jgi:hypothetical protein
MIPSMKNFRAAVFTLKFGEVVLCDFYLRMDWKARKLVLGGINSAAISA